ncbi:MAG TPA: NAD(P)-dependent oxidoreductase [Sandaracinaceae bacterium LLY-WYZ-13_1]|nr:NAD(P)-dependent oxidoreductase [Sandaracinaceae bacterium LLY-WYZ-13_1]
MELEGRTLAVTGVGGFIGRRAVERALARGMRVRGLDLRVDGVADLEVDARAGDVTDPEAAAWLADGADALLHAAAVVREDGPRALYERVNVGGTRTVARAAARAAVPRVIHLSSVMVYGFDFPDGVTEEGPFPSRETNPYVVTKLRSEGVAMAAHRRGTEVTILRPGDVYGAGSVPWVIRPLELMRQGLFVLPGAGDGIFNHLHVDNLIDAAFSALERDVSGVPINVTDGARTTFRAYFEALAATAGLPPPRHAPAALLGPAFGLLEAGFRAVGREPPARRAALDFLRRPGAYGIERARALLGYTPRIDLEAGLAALRCEL